MLRGGRADKQILLIKRESISSRKCACAGELNCASTVLTILCADAYVRDVSLTGLLDDGVLRSAIVGSGCRVEGERHQRLVDDQRQQVLWKFAVGAIVLKSNERFSLSIP